MKMNRYYRIAIIGIITLFLFACKKDFLEKKPNTNLVIPVTLADYQQLLDNGAVINYVSSLPLLSCDDYYLKSDADWASSTNTERNTYIWDKDPYGAEVVRRDWNLPYVSVFYSNAVIEGLQNVKSIPDQVLYNTIKGQAHFVRAFALFDLVRNFSPAYDSSTAKNDLGIPLKLSADVNEVEKRSTVEQTYNQIISDLSIASQLLSPEVTPLRNRANKPGAYALFARLYLSMRQYAKAESYADSSLTLYSKLIDYNTVSKTSTTPFTADNDESLFFAIQAGGTNNALYNPSRNIGIVKDLLDSYSPNDLRRTIYFSTNISTELIKPKRGYSGSNSNPFGGLATDEIYLIKAECAARRNNVPVAMDYLNRLLINRFEKNTFIPIEATSSNDALNIILLERRKELVWRTGTRWDDLRRLNKEGANITLKRVINGITYTLSPNDPRYIFPIPQSEVNMNGLIQNIR